MRTTNHGTICRGLQIEYSLNNGFGSQQAVTAFRTFLSFPFISAPPVFLRSSIHIASIKYEVGRGNFQTDKRKSFVPFPEHFVLVANPESMTVLLSPQYSKTYGLAVT